MFGFVINKLKNRKWLNLCLLMGVALFIALFVCHPMFEKGAGNQILDRLFTDHATQQNEFPAEDDKADALGVGAAVSCAFDFIYKNDICTDTFARGK